MAWKVNLAKLSRVAVQALAKMQQSLILAIISNLLGTGTETLPVPLGVGKWCTSTVVHRATTARHLARGCVGLANLVPPVVLLHGDYGDFGQDEGPTNCSGYLLTPGLACCQM